MLFSGTGKAHPRSIGSDPRVDSGAYRRAWQGGLRGNKSGPHGLTTWYPLVLRVLNPFMNSFCPDSNLLEGFWASVCFQTTSVSPPGRFCFCWVTKKIRVLFRAFLTSKLLQVDLVPPPLFGGCLIHFSALVCPVSQAGCGFQVENTEKDLNSKTHTWYLVPA